MNRMMGTLAIFLGGCCARYETAECGTGPTEDITHLNVRVGTGTDGTDSTIQLCVMLKSGAENCYDLDNFLQDDFSSNSIDTFDLDVDIAAGDLKGMYLDNLGDAGVDPNDPVGDLLLSGSDWTPTSIKVTATLDGGASVVLYAETDMCDAKMDAGDSYPFMDCAY